MPTLADLFGAAYRADGVDFGAVRLHGARSAGDPVGRACRALGARAFAAGRDIYFAAGALRPDTRAGLWLLAHEVAHVVQQATGTAGAAPGEEPGGRAGGWPARGWPAGGWPAAPTAAWPVAPAGGWPVAPPGTACERAASAAADALLAGRPTVFGRRRGRGPGPPVVQRYMGWEHAMLGDLEPAQLRAAAGADPAPLAAYRDLLGALGRAPQEVDEERVRAGYPGIDLVRLPGSGLVVTLGELNMLPDYLGRPEEIETAPAGFVEPLIQSLRSWNIAELAAPAGRDPGSRRSVADLLLRPGPAPATRLLPGALRYPLLGPLAETAEIAAVNQLGKRHGFPPAHRYAAVLARNAGHFAPFSWYRWHAFHQAARDLIAESDRAGGPDRAALRQRARIYAGYADHFLQDSFAAGHLVNKTLLIQWYIEWLAGQGVSYPGRAVLDTLTVARQPLLHGPGHYDRAGARARADGAPGGRPGGVPGPPWDPQDVADAAGETDRIAGSGVVGDSDAERRAAYRAYLALLGSGTVQLAVRVAHEYFNRNGLIVAAGPQGTRFRLNGDHTLLDGPAGAARAAAAAAASRRAITELLRDGVTAVDSWAIFESFPGYVEQGGRLISLPQWHQGPLRDLCTELFAQRSTRALRGFMSAAFPRLGPAVDD